MTEPRVENLKPLRSMGGIFCPGWSRTYYISGIIDHRWLDVYVRAVNTHNVSCRGSDDVDVYCAIRPSGGLSSIFAVLSSPLRPFFTFIFTFHHDQQQ